MISEKERKYAEMQFNTNEVEDSLEAQLKSKSEK